MICTGLEGTGSFRTTAASEAATTRAWPRVSNARPRAGWREHPSGAHRVYTVARHSDHFSLRLQRLNDGHRVLRSSTGEGSGVPHGWPCPAPTCLRLRHRAPALLRSQCAPALQSPARWRGGLRVGRPEIDTGHGHQEQLPRLANDFDGFFPPGVLFFLPERVRPEAREDFLGALLGRAADAHTPPLPAVSSRATTDQDRSRSHGRRRGLHDGLLGSGGFNQRRWLPRYQLAAAHCAD